MHTGGDTAQHEYLRFSCAQVIEIGLVIVATVEELVFIVILGFTFVIVDCLTRREMSVVDLNRQPPATQVSTNAVLCGARNLLGGNGF